MDWSLVGNFAAAIVAILNPLGNVLLFITFTAREPRAVRQALAVLLAATIFAFLLAFLLVGKIVLDLFGVSLAAFQIAGGILLLLIGIGMVQGQTGRSKQEAVARMEGQPPADAPSSLWASVQPSLKPLEPCSEERGVWQDALGSYSKLLIPLCVPIFVGPGSISTVILYAGRAESRETFLGLMATLGIVSGLVLVCLLAGEWLKQALNDVGLDVAVRLLGLLLAAVGIQFVLGGLSKATVNFINPEILGSVVNL